MATQNLLTLPFDIRHLIYSFLFAKSSRHIIYKAKPLAEQTPPDAQKSVQTSSLVLKPRTEILRVCKQIYAEALPLLYSNAFVLDLGAFMFKGELSPLPILNVDRKQQRKGLGQLKMFNWYGRTKRGKDGNVPHIPADTIRQLRNLEVCVDVQIDRLAERTRDYEAFGENAVLDEFERSTSVTRFRELLEVLCGEQSNQGGTGDRDLASRGRKILVLMLDNGMWSRGVNFGDRLYTEKEVQVLMRMLQREGIVPLLKQLRAVRAFDVRGAHGAWDFDKRIWLRQNVANIKRELEMAVDATECPVIHGSTTQPL